MSLIQEYVNKQKLLNNKNVEEVDNLILDGLNIRELSVDDKNYMEQFKKLSILYMNGCNLRSTNNFPYIPSLICIELHDNHLETAEQAKSLSLAFPNLKVLYMAGNKIKDYSFIEQLNNAKELLELDIDSNPIMSIEDKPETVIMKIFQLIPTLKIVNNLNTELEEIVNDTDSSQENSKESENDDFVISDEEENDSNNNKSLLHKLAYGEFSENDENDAIDYNPDTDSVISEGDDINYDDEDDDNMDDISLASEEQYKSKKMKMEK